MISTIITIFPRIVTPRRSHHAGHTTQVTNVVIRELLNLRRPFRYGQEYSKGFQLKISLLKMLFFVYSFCCLTFCIFCVDENSRKLSQKFAPPPSRWWGGGGGGEGSNSFPHTSHDLTPIHRMHRT